MQETKLNGESLDIILENVSKLKELFPEIVAEDKIDFEKLKEVLGEYTEEDNERYNFTWKGKSAALRLAQTPSTGTLRPCKEESKNWNSTENLYIEGDNLEVLKLLQKSYYGKIKMIYIDPPYNTGKEFVYPDDYKDNLYNYLEMTGQVDSEGIKISTNTDSSGRYHTNWLNMIYPRLRLARNLLSDEGVIFISIDDNEVENLKKVCNEVFGEENFVGQWNWFKSETPPNLSYKIKKNVEYILGYEKKKTTIKFSGLKKNSKSDDPMTKPQNTIKVLNFPPNSLNINLKDQIIKKGTYGTEKYPNILLNDLIVENKTNRNEVSFKNKFIWIQEKLMDELAKGTKLNLSKSLVLSYKKSEYANEVPPNFINSKIGNTTEKAGEELTNLFGFKVFDYPKPKELLKYLFNFLDTSNNIILDFFSGSATTAHAVLDLNAVDEGNRKFILVQLPEPTNETDNAYKFSYKNICEIGKERIRRSGDKIVSELQNNGQTSLDGKKAPDLDIGFKVFKLDSSNLQKWDPDYENLEQTLLDSVENLVPGRSELDLVYEVMLKYGIDLTLPVEEFTVQDKKVYSIGFGALLICLEDKITADMASEIIKLKEELAPEVMRVVFKDNGFVSDSDKTNFKETLKTNGIEEFVSI